MTIHARESLSEKEIKRQRYRRGFLPEINSEIDDEINREIDSKINNEIEDEINGEIDGEIDGNYDKRASDNSYGSNEPIFVTPLATKFYSPRKNSPAATYSPKVKLLMWKMSSKSSNSEVFHNDRVELRVKDEGNSFLTANDRDMTT
ncbi:hypothetical protein FNV43_RR27025 [Rhamnella rubrinervis]|uniref:Uncharacterized protein n=1 Tax=Rhamnella rubrinervis TaxID=2594499 RepID=A0A8K0DP62_9ROSA|nr:hypothetical protein FNV43_RR27025 [Rhamnella rubrinervis]